MFVLGKKYLSNVLKNNTCLCSNFYDSYLTVYIKTAASTRLSIHIYIYNILKRLNTTKMGKIITVKKAFIFIKETFS